MATTEVSDILTICECLKEANVYGVKVPGYLSLYNPCGQFASCCQMRDFHLVIHFCMAMQATRAGSEWQPSL